MQSTPVATTLVPGSAGDTIEDIAAALLSRKPSDAAGAICDALKSVEDRVVRNTWAQQVESARLFGEIEDLVTSVLFWIDAPCSQATVELTDMLHIQASRTLQVLCYAKKDGVPTTAKALLEKAGFLDWLTHTLEQSHEVFVPLLLIL